MADKLNAATVVERLGKVVKAHGSIHHHAAQHAAEGYEASALKAKAEQAKPKP